MKKRIVICFLLLILIDLLIASAGSNNAQIGSNLSFNTSSSNIQVSSSNSQASSSSNIQVSSSNSQASSSSNIQVSSSNGQASSSSNIQVSSSNGQESNIQVSSSNGQESNIQVSSSNSQASSSSNVQINDNIYYIKTSSSVDKELVEPVIFANLKKSDVLLSYSDQSPSSKAQISSMNFETNIGSPKKNPADEIIYDETILDIFSQLLHDLKNRLKSY